MNGDTDAENDTDSDYLFCCLDWLVQAGSGWFKLV